MDEKYCRACERAFESVDTFCGQCAELIPLIGQISEFRSGLPMLRTCAVCNRDLPETQNLLEQRLCDDCTECSAEFVAISSDHAMTKGPEYIAAWDLSTAE